MDKVPMKATDECELERMIMDSNIAKSESAWWASYEITKLRKDLAEREAEILKLRVALDEVKLRAVSLADAQVVALEALSTPPSTSYLEQWERERYGEPVAYINVNAQRLEFALPTTFATPKTVDLQPIPLYVRKEK